MLTSSKDYSNGSLKYGLQLLECTWIIHPQHQLPIDGTNTTMLLLLAYEVTLINFLQGLLESLLIHLQLFTRLSNTLVFYFCHLQYRSLGGSVGEGQLMRCQRCQKHLLRLKLKLMRVHSSRCMAQHSAGLHRHCV